MSTEKTEWGGDFFYIVDNISFKRKTFELNPVLEDLCSVRFNALHYFAPEQEHQLIGCSNMTGLLINTTHLALSDDFRCLYNFESICNPKSYQK